MWLWQPLLAGGAELQATVAPTVTTTALSALQVGSAFSQQLAATGTDPITWTGTVPDGLTLSSAGLLSGTPTTAGAYSFTVTATNSYGSDDQEYTGTISAAGAARPPAGTRVAAGTRVSIFLARVA